MPQESSQQLHGPEPSPYRRDVAIERDVSKANQPAGGARKVRTNKVPKVMRPKRQHKGS
jgi:hypothetical protein